MSEILGKLMEILYKRGYVEYHSSLYANVLKEYNLEVPGKVSRFCLMPMLVLSPVRA